MYADLFLAKSVGDVTNALEGFISSHKNWEQGERVAADTVKDDGLTFTHKACGGVCGDLRRRARNWVFFLF